MYIEEYVRRAAVFDRNNNGWVTVPEDMDLPDNQQDRDNSG